MSVVCCQVDVSATGRSLIQRSPTECGVSECDRGASIMRRLKPTRAVAPCKKCKTSVSDFVASQGVKLDSVSVQLRNFSPGTLHVV